MGQISLRNLKVAATFGRASSPLRVRKTEALPYEKCAPKAHRYFVNYVNYFTRTRNRTAFVLLIPRELNCQRRPLILVSGAGLPAIQETRSAVHAQVSHTPVSSIDTKTVGENVDVLNT